MITPPKSAKCSGQLRKYGLNKNLSQGSWRKYGLNKNLSQGSWKGQSVLNLYLLFHLILLPGKKRKTLSSTSSSSMRLSSAEIHRIMDRLKSQQHRDSTAKNFLCIWHLMNKFLVRLDFIPDSWEERYALFSAY